MDEQRATTTSDKAENKTEPVLKLNFLSHGTLISKDLDASRRFYEDFLGLDVVRTSPISLMVRLGGDHIYAVVENKNFDGIMPFLYHNGLDVETQEEVDEAHLLCVEHANQWGLQKISSPSLQHGSYSFYFWDADGNGWEILTNPNGGYRWLFEMGDLEGKGHLDPTFKRPGVKTPESEEDAPEPAWPVSVVTPADDA